MKQPQCEIIRYKITFKQSSVDIQIVTAEITMQQLLLLNEFTLHILCCFECESTILCLASSVRTL